MATKPTEVIPDWASAGDIVIPTAGKVVTGFYPGEKPAAQYVNWFWNLVRDWVTYLSEEETQIPAAAAVHCDDSAFGHHFGWSIASDTGGLALFEFPIVKPVGFVVNDLTVYMKEPNLVGEVFTAKIFQYNPVTGTPTQLSTTKTSGFTGTYATMGWTSADADVPFTMATKLAYFIEIEFDSTSIDSEALVLGVGINDQ